MFSSINFVNVKYTLFALIVNCQYFQLIIQLSSPRRVPRKQNANGCWPNRPFYVHSRLIFRRLDQQLNLMFVLLKRMHEALNSFRSIINDTVVTDNSQSISYRCNKNVGVPKSNLSHLHMCDIASSCLKRRFLGPRGLLERPKTTAKRCSNVIYQMYLANKAQTDF